VRLLLERAMPLRPGDRLLLRDPGSRAVAGATVLDPEPPALARRGDAAGRAAALAATPDWPATSGGSAGSVGSASMADWVADELRRRGCVPVAQLRRLGLEAVDGVGVRRGDWLLDTSLVPALSARVRSLVSGADALADGLPTAAVAQELGLPVDLVPAVVPADLAVRNGRVRRPEVELPAGVAAAVETLLRELAGPFEAPPRDRLTALGLDRRAVAAAGRAGRLLVLEEGWCSAPAPTGTRWRCCRACRSRSPRARHVRRSAARVAWCCRCWRCWIAPGVPCACPTTAAASADPRQTDRPSAAY
jgi:selenocysteine-specific elongation factor